NLWATISVSYTPLMDQETSISPVLSEEERSEEARCSSCMNLIEEEEFFSALGKDWHTECFRYF
ncbi:hypothetical protein Avbf_01368, partial [Armadillidium vulgare]